MGLGMVEAERINSSPSNKSSVSLFTSLATKSVRIIDGITVNVTESE